MVGKALQFPTSMSMAVWGVATQVCPKLPPQSGISYVTDNIDLIVDDFFLVPMAGKACLLAGLVSVTQRFRFLSLDFSQTLQSRNLTTVTIILLL
jgi:hypothetical protein